MNFDTAEEFETHLKNSTKALEQNEQSVKRRVLAWRTLGWFVEEPMLWALIPMVLFILLAKYTSLFEMLLAWMTA